MIGRERVWMVFSLAGVISLAACEGRSSHHDGGRDAFDARDDGEPGSDGFDGGDSDDISDGDLSLNPACEPWVGLFDSQLVEALHEETDGQQALSYDEARHTIFSSLDNHDGWVECVYTGQQVQTQGIPDVNVMNVEHTFPQSWGSDTLPAKSDLNHLFPAMSIANIMRSAHPFGMVLQVDWEQGGSKYGLDGWGNEVFEPRDQHKGDAARAMFYFVVRYQTWMEDGMENILRQWNRQDPPDEKEKLRDDDIEQIQQKRNPFVDCPELVDRIADF